MPKIGSCQHWFGVFVSVGHKGVMGLNTLPGKLFMHEVGEWSGGERICVSHYIEDNVHEHLKVP